MDVKQIKSNYSQMYTGELLKLVSEIKDLREEVIPILRAELEKRNEKKHVLEIDEYLSSKSTTNNEGSLEDIIDIDAYVNARLASGELMESIVDDLKSRRVDLMSRALENSLKEEDLIESISEQKYAGQSDEEIKQEYSFNDKEINFLEKKIKLKSKNNLQVGVLSIIAGVFLLFLGVLGMHLRILIFAVGVIIFGINKIFVSNKQKKSVL